MDGGSGANGSAAAALARTNGRGRRNGSARHARLLRFLSQVPLLADLDEASLKQLSHLARTQRFRGRTVVSGPQRKCEGLSLVLSGALKVCTSAHQGREAILSLLGPGDHFGEFCAVAGAPGRPRVVALRRSDVATLPAAAFADLLAHHPAVMKALLRATAERVRRAEGTLQRLALHDVTGRVTDTLMQLAADDGEAHDDGILLRRRPSQTLLAGLAGSTRETVSRVLKDLEARRLIECDGRRVLIRSQTEAAGCPPLRRAPHAPEPVLV